MHLNEIINNLTLKALDDMRLHSEKSSMSVKDYNNFVTDTVVDTYLRVQYAVINGEKKKD